MWSMVSNAECIVKNIVMNIKEGTFSRMVFSISRLESGHKADFIKVSL